MNERITNTDFPDLYLGLDKLELDEEFRYAGKANVQHVRTQESDIDWIVELESQTTNVGLWTREQHHDVINKNGWLHVVLVDPDTRDRVGYYIQRFHTDNDGKGAIDSMRKVVFPQFRSKGYGTTSLRLIWQHHFEGSNAHLIDYIWLDVFTDNGGARKLYEKQGWEPVGNEIPATDVYGNPLIDKQGNQRSLQKYVCTRARYEKIKANKQGEDSFR